MLGIRPCVFVVGLAWITTQASCSGDAFESGGASNGGAGSSNGGGGTGNEGAGGGNGGSGAKGGSGGKLSDGGLPDVVSLDADIDVGPPLCEGKIVCYLTDGTTGKANCNNGPPVAQCLPSDWDYCHCNNVAQRMLILDPPSGTGQTLTSVTLIVEPNNEPYALSIDGYCPGYAPSTSTCSVGPSCGTAFKVYRWGSEALQVDPQLGNSGAHTVQIFSADQSPPCDSAATLMQASYVK